MFHPFDKNTQTTNPRQAWMALLSRAPQHMLDHALRHHIGLKPHWLRRPETGLMMVQGRVGGSGERFNLGEVTVTRCALHVSDAAIDKPLGVSYVLGRNHRQAQLAAMADALLQDPEHYEIFDEELLKPLRQQLQAVQAARYERAQTTKVDFMTLARETTRDDEEDEA